MVHAITLADALQLTGCCAPQERDVYPPPLAGFVLGGAAVPGIAALPASVVTMPVPKQR